MVKVLQGREVVRDAIIDPGSPEKNFGNVARDNRLIRGERCNALLVHFDLTKLQLPPNAKLVKAAVSFYVWDPSPGGNTKICAFGLKTAWDEAAVTWQRPDCGGRWKGGQAFKFGVDTLPPGRHVVVLPDQGRDTVDPPLEYRLDVTPLVRAWLSGKAENYGLAIAPVIDRAIDDGRQARFQVVASEDARKRYTPKLTIGLLTRRRKAAAP